MIRSITRVAGALAAVTFLATPLAAVSNDHMSQTGSMSGSMTGQSMDMPMGEVVQVGDLEISHAFTRAMPPRAVSGGGFVTIHNKGEQDDRLVSARSPAAEFVETHIMSMEGDVMMMRSQPEGFLIKAGETLELAPGGKHLMFINAVSPFQEGEEIAVTLVFERAGEVELVLPVMGMGTKGMHGEGMGHMNMDHSSMEHSDSGNGSMEHGQMNSEGEAGSEAGSD